MSRQRASGLNGAGGMAMEPDYSPRCPANVPVQEWL